MTADATTSDVDAARNDAFFAGVQAYRRAQLSAAILVTRAAAVRDQEAHLDVTGQRIRAGKAPRYLLARDRAALAVVKQMREDAAAERDEAVDDLSVVLAFDQSTPPQIATPLEVASIHGTLDQFVRRALAQAPTILGAQLREQAARSTVAGARGAYSPTATLSGDGGTRSANDDKARATLLGAQVVLERRARVPNATSATPGANCKLRSKIS